MSNFSKSNRMVATVFETTEYSQFKTLTGNRDVGQKRFDKIEASMLIKQLPIPIIVNEKMEVIDGQGRLAVCKKHGLPVYYTVVPGLDICDCETVNIYATQWSTVDRLKRYAKTGNENYTRCLRVMERFGVDMQVVLLASGKSGYSTDRRTKALTGGMIFTESDEDTSTERLLMVESIITELESAGGKVKQKKNVRDAIIRCSKEPGYDHGRMRKACHDSAINYRDCPTVAETLQQFARFYNKGKRNDYMDVFGTRSNLKVKFGEKEDRTRRG